MTLVFEFEEHGKWYELLTWRLQSELDAAEYHELKEELARLVRRYEAHDIYLRAVLVGLDERRTLVEIPA